MQLNPEEHLSLLAKDAEELFGDDLNLRIEGALNVRSNIVVELAAKLVTSRETRVSTESLVKAFEYFLEDPVERDKNCRAKIPIVEALNFLEFDDPDFYMQGIVYRQLEPAWGDPVETAANVRGACAFGLIRCRSASPAATMLSLVDLLNDSESVARVHGAQAISETGSPSALPVLRLKVLMGDAKSEVIGECFRGLLANDLSSSISFISPYLRQDFDHAIEAATALGATGDERAVKEVISACDGCDRDLVEGFYLTLALSRLPIAIDFLLSQIANDTPNAADAVRAFAPTRFYVGIKERVERSINEANNVQLRKLFRESFADG